MKKITVYLSLLVALVCMVSCASCKGKSEVEVTLEGNATTGYMWSCIPDNSGVYEVSKEDYVPYKTSKGMAGTGGQYKAVLVPVKQGTGSVRFIYQRAWEDSPIEEKTFTVNVDEKMNITVK